MIGYIGFSNNTVGIVPKLIRFFTNSHISHTFIGTESFMGVPSIQEASDLIVVKPFVGYEQSLTESFKLYKIREDVVSEDTIKEATKKVYEEFEGVRYGYLQLVWFPYRWLLSLVGIDARKQKNWMTDGVICSELVYWFLWYLGPVFQDLIKDFNPDTIQAQDLLDIVNAHPHLFEFVREKNVNHVIKMAV